MSRQGGLVLDAYEVDEAVLELLAEVVTAAGAAPIEVNISMTIKL